MSSHILSYRTLDGTSPIGELLDMVARRGPILMRQGGGSLRREQLWSGRHLEDADRLGIYALAESGQTIAEIAKSTGWSFKTVWKTIKANPALKLPERRLGRPRKA